MEIKGQDQSAHVWSDMIANKLGKMCPLDKRGADRLMLTVGPRESSFGHILTKLI